MADESSGKLTTGWKVAIVLGILTGIGGGGRAESEARSARQRTDWLRGTVSQLEGKVRDLEGRIRGLRRAGRTGGAADQPSGGPPATGEPVGPAEETPEPASRTAAPEEAPR